MVVAVLADVEGCEVESHHVDDAAHPGNAAAGDEFSACRFERLSDGGEVVSELCGSQVPA